MKPVSFVRTAPTALGDENTGEGVRCFSCGQVIEDSKEAGAGSYANPLSVDELLIQHPHATFFMQVGDTEHVVVEGSSYLGVEQGDIVVIHRAVTPTLGKLVLAVCDGVFTLCRFTEHESKQFLVCGTGHDSAVELGADSSAALWGVVTAVVRQL